MMSRNLNIRMFDIGKKLGQGGFGSVFLVKEKESNFILAIKMIKKCHINENNLTNQIKREIEIQRNLCHPNISVLWGHFDDSKRIYIMLEYAPNGDLSSDIVKYGRYCDERAATYMYQLTDAIRFCHVNFVMHQDIKSSNILIGVSGQIKLADFGWAMHKHNSRNSNYLGTMDYRAPEICLGKYPGYEADIWSVGVVMYEMLTGSIPFDHSEFMEKNKKIIEGNYTIPEFVNSQAQDLIKQILQTEPDNRLTVDQIVNHEYISLFSENSLEECKSAETMWKTKTDC